MFQIFYTYLKYLACCVNCWDMISLMLFGECYQTKIKCFSSKLIFHKSIKVFWWFQCLHYDNKEMKTMLLNYIYQSFSYKIQLFDILILLWRKNLRILLFIICREWKIFIVYNFSYQLYFEKLLKTIKYFIKN